MRREGRIVVERQPSGERKGEWLFNRATVESIDRLYDAYESQPIVPELTELGLASPAAGFAALPACGCASGCRTGYKKKIHFTRHMAFFRLSIVGAAAVRDCS